MCDLSGLCTPCLQEGPFTCTTSWISVLKLGSMVALTSPFLLVNASHAPNHSVCAWAPLPKRWTHDPSQLIKILSLEITATYCRTTYKSGFPALRSINVSSCEKSFCHIKTKNLSVRDVNIQEGRTERRKTWNRFLMLRADPQPSLNYSWAFRFCDLVKFPPLFSQVSVEPLLLTTPRALANTDT